MAEISRSSKGWIALALMFLPAVFAQVPPGDAEMLQKVEDLEQWGFTDAAEVWYTRLTHSSSEDVRYRAFSNRVRLLQKSGNKAGEMSALEEMLAAFPKDPQITRWRQDLYRYYRETWQWAKACRVAEEILAKDRPERSEELNRVMLWTENWEKRAERWQEDFDAPLKWCLGHPTFYRRDSYTRQMEVTTVTGSWYSATQFFYWQGDSTALTFDIQVKRMDWTGMVSFGIISRDSFKDWLLAIFSSSGGTGDIHYNFSFNAARSGVRAETRYRTGNAYKIGVWYRVEIDYLKEIHEARLRIREREGNAITGEEIAAFSLPLPPGEYLIGCWHAERSGGHPAALAEAAFDNVRLNGGAWEAPRRKRKMEKIYTNNALAQTDPEEALRQYDLQIQAKPENWQALEMRAYLWKSVGNAKNFRADLERVLRLKPDHDNRAYFEKLLQE